MPRTRSSGRPAGRTSLAAVGACAVLALGSLGHSDAEALRASNAEPSTPGAGLARAAVRGASSRPNIVVVMADDMRVDELRFAPNVRRLVAGRGLSFENSFAPYPLCCPSRASLLTGSYSHNHRVYSHVRKYGYGAFDDSRTLATSLRRVGYTTGFVGKYLNRYGLDRSRVSGRPSLRYVPRGWTRWVASVEPPPGSGIRGGTFHYRETPFTVDGRIDDSFRGEYQTSVIGDFSVDMVRRFAQNPRPFFMYVNFLAPHNGAPHERDDPKAFHDRFGNRVGYGTPARPRWVVGRFDGVIGRGAGMPRNGAPSEGDMSDKPAAFRNLQPINASGRRALRNLTRQRAEAVFVMDQEIGRLVRRLKAAGEWDDTWFVFTSDNGYYLGEHRKRQGKIYAHEPSLRVPLLMTGPGHRVREKRYDPVSTVDLTATLVDLAGARPPRPPDGSSRVPTIESGDRGWKVPIVTEAVGTAHGPGIAWRGTRTSIGLRTARYSYTRYRNGQTELYDLLIDPLQLASVHRDRDYLEVRRTLLRTWKLLRDCRGRTCRVAGPESLRATATENRELTTAYWEAIDRAYGW